MGTFLLSLLSNFQVYIMKWHDSYNSPMTIQMNKTLHKTQFHLLLLSPGKHWSIEWNFISYIIYIVWKEWKERWTGQGDRGGGGQGQERGGGYICPLTGKTAYWNTGTHPVVTKKKKIWTSWLTVLWKKIKTWQLAFPLESYLNFPWEKSKWDNTVVKKYNTKKTKPKRLNGTLLNQTIYNF